MAAAMTVARRVTALTIAGVALSIGIGAGSAWAHSPTDFLKVPVGQQAMVLLPPMTALPGRMQVAIDAPAGYRLTDASAGPGWQSRVAANAAILDGQRVAGTSVLLSLTGVASHAGAFPIDIRLSSTVAPTEAFQWRLTALNGYARPVAANVGTARPDAAVDLPTSSGPVLWPVSIACALGAFALLVVRRRPRESAVRVEVPAKEGDVLRGAVPPEC